MNAIRNDVTKVKEINIELIKNVLKTNGEMTKAQIAEETGISVATCGKILNDMAASGEAIAHQNTQNGYGRPAKSYRYNAEFALVACLFIWSDAHQLELVTAVSDLLGEIVWDEVRELDTIDYDQIEALIAQLIARESRIKIVTIGIPGVIDDGVITQSYLTELNGVAIREKLEKRFPTIKTITENAANAAAYGYYRTGDFSQDTTIGYLFVPTDIRTGRSKEELWTSQERFSQVLQSGFVSQGRIVRGASGFAGQIWYLAQLEQANALTGEMLAKLIAISVPTLNPEAIAIVGSGIDEEKLTQMETYCAKLIPQQHLPRLVLRPDCRIDYINGLTIIALQKLSCGVELVKKQI